MIRVLLVVRKLNILSLCRLNSKFEISVSFLKLVGIDLLCKKAQKINIGQGTGS